VELILKFKTEENLNLKLCVMFCVYAVYIYIYIYILEFYCLVQYLSGTGSSSLKYL